MRQGQYKGGSYKDLSFIQMPTDDELLLYGRYKKRKKKKSRANVEISAEDILNEFWNG